VVASPRAQVDRWAKRLGPALYRAAVALGQTRDASEVVRVAITEAQRAAHLEAVALYVLDTEGQVLMLRDAVGTSMGFRERTTLVPVHDAGPVTRAIQGQEITTIPVAGHPSAELRAAFAEHGFRYVTVAPVTGRHQTLGVLYLASRELQPLSPNESALVQAIGGLVGVALENATLWGTQPCSRTINSACARSTRRWSRPTWPAATPGGSAGPWPCC
jgi:GAF domain-containing protein